MKKNLLFLVMSFASFYIVQAQTIDIEGKGVLGTNEATLYISDLTNIDHVVVEAAAVFVPGSTPDTVIFSDSNELDSVSFSAVDVDKTPPNSYHFGYYTTTFSDVGAEGITLNKLGQGDQIMTLYAYIYRTNGVVNKYSMLDMQMERAFMYKNGSTNPLEYEFTLSGIIGIRNIEVVVPFSDNEEEAERHAVAILILSDGSEVSSDLRLNTSGDNFVLDSLAISSVPGNVIGVKIEVYSPNPSVDGETGDSFFVGMPVLTVEEWEGCSLTQGYWKTHSEEGPAPYDDTWALLGGGTGAGTMFYNTSQTWYDVFWTPVAGNVYYQAAHQYMAAYLNSLNGIWVPEEVQDAMDDADSIFTINMPAYYEKVKGKSDASKSEIKELNDIASILASYNEGEIGPGHCGDLDTEPELKSAFIDSDVDVIKNFIVYPNPARNMATVSFVPINDGFASVELYNSLGQKLNVLYNKNVVKNIPVSVEFDASPYNSGLYIIRFKNNTDIATKKFSIRK